MSANAGPDIVEDGIVFYYDTGNTVKSYIGEPLVNCATDLSSGYNVTVTEVTDRSITPPFPGMRVYKFITANNYNLHRQGGYYNGGGFGGSNPQPLILGTTTPSNFTTVGTGKYRFGMYIRGEVTNQVGDGVTIDIGDRNQVGTTVGTNTNWQLIETNDTLGIADSNYPYDFFDIGASFNMTFYVAGYGIWRSPGTVTNLPFLQAYPISTQYITYGQSRSVTEGLLDMTGAGTIDLTNASFTSNAQLTFDGTNDTVSVNSYPAIELVDNVSIEYVYMRLATDPILDVIANKYHSTGWELFCTTGNEFALAGRNGDGTYYATTNAAYTIENNKYYHLIAMKEGLSWRLYVNGQLYASLTANTIGTWSNTGILQIGGEGAGYYPNMNLPVLKIYNRVLSASEVLTNYNAFKTRFGI